MMDPRDMPTAADYANGNSLEALRRSKRVEDSSGHTAEEQVVMLQGQVSFLAGFVYDLLNGHGWHSDEDLKMLDRIKDYVKE